MAGEGFEAAIRGVFVELGIDRADENEDAGYSVQVFRCAGTGAGGPGILLIFDGDLIHAGAHGIAERAGSVAAATGASACAVRAGAGGWIVCGVRGVAGWW